MTNATEVRLRTGGRDVSRIVYAREEIATRVAEMGREISAHYPAGEDLLVLGLLKGSFIFLADLVREIARPVHVDFLVAASYGSGTESSGIVRLLYEPEADLARKHVLLVEDIIDSGKTIDRCCTNGSRRRWCSMPDGWVSMHRESFSLVMGWTTVKTFGTCRSLPASRLGPAGKD
jgi:hypoxanthine-guanine phosphoribosyltransferase